MSKRTATWLAWSMCALSLVLTALSLILLTLNRSHGYIVDFWFEITVIPATFPIVGAVIISSRPENVIGWLLCTDGLVTAVVHFTGEYALYSVIAQPGSLPGGEALGWLAYWLWTLGAGLIVPLFLLFPTGQLPSSRWRWFAAFSAIAILVGAISMSFSPTLAPYSSFQNPLGTRSLEGVDRIIEPLIFILVLIAIASMFIRLRYAREVERQQIKWVAYAGVLAFSGIILRHSLFVVTNMSWIWWVGFIPNIVGFIGIPVAMGIAILRYRLFEIDLIINRTLVYGALTAILALVYFGSVTALQYLFSLLTGQGNTLAIVASTLAIAALFNPLRRRFQGFIDRRFYRRKYDARKTLEAFGSRLRDETDLERISEDLLEVVDETMKPAHVSVVLRSEGPSTTTREQGQQDQQTTTHEG
jgi:hypothetical protein